jgi:hypothetical protein
VKVLSTLRFLACGGYQTGVGYDIHLGISQSSVCRSLKEVTEAINTHLFNEWVHLPRNMAEINSVKNGFYQRYNMPGVMEAIDCTHVAIASPSGINPNYPEHVYLNRKHYHSINVQLVCDVNLKILNVNARYPGSTNDAFIWRNSRIRQAMIAHHGRHPNSTWLLGDSGYSQLPWLFTPILNAEPGTPNDRYNTSHKRARNSVERCNGLLKNRFRALLKHRVLHYSPEAASRIINAAVVLHNMCLYHQIPEPDRNEEIINADFGIIDEDINNAANVNQNILLLRGGRMLRQRIVNEYFA